MEMPKKENVEEELMSFVASDQFPNFKKLLNNYANGQFKAMMDATLVSSEDIKVAREVLGFYLKFPTLLEKKVASIKRDREIALAERISKAQRSEE